ncbi:IclR family transcriptional regulator [Quadrisphaera granulorum]|uniref:IclR family transcriptional regulator n=1 Tax=Quadrisphaera granulorum TaxID=317664 RepID=UPI0011B685A0|nr:IclR family transcriptional regulator [Quadrisphaera granulorum]
MANGAERMIQSVQRAFALIERLAAAPDGLRLSDLADGLGLNRSTAHNLLGTLEVLGYVEQRHRGAPYRLTGKLDQLLPPRVETELALRARARPVLEEVATRTGETVYLAFAAGDHYLCSDAVQSTEPLHLTVTPGEREPLLGTAIGHALLAGNDRLAERLAEADPKGWSHHAQRVSEAREQGFAVDEEGFHPGVSCVAVSLPGGAAMGVAGPASRLDHSRLLAFAAVLRQATRGLR